MPSSDTWLIVGAILIVGGVIVNTIKKNGKP